MSEKTAIRKDENLTECCILIFGSIVESAYFTTWDINTGKDYTKKRLDRYHFVTNPDSEIPMNGNEIWIRFKNGNTVSFSVSEWGMLEKADTENSYEN